VLEALSSSLHRDSQNLHFIVTALTAVLAVVDHINAIGVSPDRKFWQPNVGHQAAAIGISQPILLSA